MFFSSSKADLNAKFGKWKIPFDFQVLKTKRHQAVSICFKI